MSTWCWRSLTIHLRLSTKSLLHLSLWESEFIHALYAIQYFHTLPGLSDSEPVMQCKQRKEVLLSNRFLAWLDESLENRWIITDDAANENFTILCKSENNLTSLRYLCNKLDCVLSNFYLKSKVTIINGTFVVLMLCFVIQKCKLLPLPLRKSYPATSHFSFFHL